MQVFKDCADAICVRWMEIIGNCDGRTVIDITSWLSRGALDSIGQGILIIREEMLTFSIILIAAFDVQLGTVQDNAHPLAKKYENYLFVSSIILRASSCNLIPVVTFSVYHRQSKFSYKQPPSISRHIYTSGCSIMVQTLGLHAPVM